MRAGVGQKGEAGRGEDLMMMYRGRAAERRENGRGRVLLGLRSPGNGKESLNTKRGRKGGKKGSELVEGIPGMTLQVEARYFIRCSRAI